MFKIEPNDVIAVWFSCGAASAVAAKKTIEKYGAIATIRVLNNPVIEEHPDNQRFLKDVEKWIGVPIESVINAKYKECSAEEVWEDVGAMSFPKGAPCTRQLKIEARVKWEHLNKHDYHVLGFTFDEKRRYINFLNQRPNTIGILIDERITKGDCYQILNEAGLKIPEIYNLGYPNANCIGCVKATSPTYWNHVRKVHPEIFEKRANLSRELGAKLVRVNNKRIFLDELSPDAKGRPMKDMDFECGIFCSKPIAAINHKDKE